MKLSSYYYLIFGGVSVTYHKLGNFSAFYGTQSSLPRPQELSTCTYPEPDQSSAQHPIVQYCLETILLPSYLSFRFKINKSIFFKIKLSPDPETCSSYWSQMTIFHPKMETESVSKKMHFD
jgi:hypothetical protein